MGGEGGEGEPALFTEFMEFKEITNSWGGGREPAQFTEFTEFTNSWGLEGGCGGYRTWTSTFMV